MNDATMKQALQAAPPSPPAAPGLREGDLESLSYAYRGVQAASAESKAPAAPGVREALDDLADAACLYRDMVQLEGSESPEARKASAAMEKSLAAADAALSAPASPWRRVEELSGDDTDFLWVTDGVRVAKAQRRWKEHNYWRDAIHLPLNWAPTHYAAITPPVPLPAPPQEGDEDE